MCIEKKYKHGYVVQVLSITVFLWISPFVVHAASVEGSFSEVQVARGKTAYSRECTSCHGVDLRGGEGNPALVGGQFLSRWPMVGSLFVYTQATMPKDRANKLGNRETADIVAYMLFRNGFNAGEQALPVTLEELNQIEINRSTVTRTNKQATEPVAKRKSSTVDWPYYGSDSQATHYSPLNLINKDNVNKLEIAWRWSAGNFGPRPEYNYRNTPLMVDGVLYVTAGIRRATVAIDAQTGETLWMYRLDEGERGENAPRLNSGRGVAYWSDGEDKRIIVITPGYHMIALDATTGKPVSSFGNEGIVDLKQELDQDINLITDPVGSSSPPMIVGDVIVVGSALPGGTAPPRKEMLKGYVRGYDIHTGKRLWIFHTIPQANEFGNDTWDNGSWKYTGNTAVWAPMAADLELGYVYLPIEAPTGDFYGGHRVGDNLFSQSIVCLDAKSGQRVWHYQMVHHGIWDYDIPTAPKLVDITVDGRKIPAVAQITKQGFVFVFDRWTGKPVWPIEERPVPQSDVPGEKTAATQPFPTKPPPFVRQGISENDLIDFTPDIYQEALEIASQYTMGPLYTPPTLFQEGGKQGTLLLPSPLGGANWPGGALDPETGMLYISSGTESMVIRLGHDPDLSNMNYIVMHDRNYRGSGPRGLPLVKPPWGKITAINLNTGEIAWDIANSDTPEFVTEHPDLKGMDIKRAGKSDRGGLLVTASLLFAGEGSGQYITWGGGPMFRAHDKMTGEIIHEMKLPANQTGLPMTYAIDNQQYIVVAIGAPDHPAELIALTVPPE